MFDTLYHWGIGHDANPPGRGSGRYEWGSGEEPYQHYYNFLTEYNRYRKLGLTDAQIAVKCGYRNSSDLKAAKSVALLSVKQHNRLKAMGLYEKTKNYAVVAKEMGLPVSTVKDMLSSPLRAKEEEYLNTYEYLKKCMDNSASGILDVGKSAEIWLNTNKNTKEVALKMLEEDGYILMNVKIPQLGTRPGNETTVQVLVRAPEEGMSEKDIKRYAHEHKFDIDSVASQGYLDDNGAKWYDVQFPKAYDSSKVYIRYDEEGGTDMDGVIQIRRGIPEIGLDQSNYAQVRINVDDKYYMKGMAVYGSDDDIPAGYDMVYNTNKHVGTPIGKVMKPLKINEETGEVDQINPFGALIKAGGQLYTDPETGELKQGYINKVREEGEWDTWSHNLSSQFVSKQNLSLIKDQIAITEAHKTKELEEIISLTNSEIRKKLLNDFAEECDSRAVELSTDGVGTNAFHVLLPVTALTENECYCPRYTTGEKVILVRYPHAGPFEIAELTVNNNVKHNERAAKAQQVIGDSIDAIGINPKVAGILSGADFDGDTVMVIPTKGLKLKIEKPLEGLKGFDTKLYLDPRYAKGGEKEISDQTKQLLMGSTTNLITDMTMIGAKPSDIEPIVRHSMVVIDAQKHGLNYEQSAIDNHVAEIAAKYRPEGKIGGAATIISRASSQAHPKEYKEINDKSKMTPKELEDYINGKKIYRETGRTKNIQITDPTKMTKEELERYNSGKKVWRASNEKVTIKSTQMQEASDAYILVGNKNNPKEIAYADYANFLKRMAETARAEARRTQPTPVDLKAKGLYSKEVESLNKKLVEASSNDPLERKATALANKMVQERKRSNPSLADNYAHLKKEEAIAIAEARKIVGAKKQIIDISEKEWEAIQARALSSTKVAMIISKADPDQVKKYATPKSTSNRGLTNNQIMRIKMLYSQGNATIESLASLYGVSPSTILKSIK